MNDLDLAYVPAAGARTVNRGAARDGEAAATDSMPTLFESTGPSLAEQDVPDFAGRRVWLIGIGGSGMSGLAQMLKRRGAIVSGSDREASPATEALEADGITVRLARRDDPAREPVAAALLDAISAG